MEESQNRLNELNDQLEQVEEYISNDPTNEQYQQIKNDLLRVITMTENLLEVQQNEENSASYTSNTTDNVFVSNNINNSQNGLHNSWNIDLVPGDRIEVISGDRPYPGIITSINKNELQCTLKYYEYGTEVTLPLSTIKKITGKGEYHPDRLAPGLRCQCKFPADQKWYEAKIESVTSDGYTVTYTQYGNTAEVPLEYLRPLPLSALQNTKRLKERHMEYLNVVIPDNLKINATDTEAVKEKKKRKVKAIKSKARIQAKEEEQAHTQDNWKAFQTKAEKKSLKLTTAPPTKKHSLFISPDAVDGRVGVTGSGQGMTDYSQRKKYKFNLANS